MENVFFLGGRTAVGLTSVSGERQYQLKIFVVLFSSLIPKCRCKQLPSHVLRCLGHLICRLVYGQNTLSTQTCLLTVDRNETLTA